MSLRSRAEPAFLLLSLVLTGCLAWWLTFRPVAEPDATAFEALPHDLMGWHSVDIAIDEGVAELLRADHHIQRAYTRLGYLVYVYIGYYGTARGGSPDHTPDLCYPAQGWTVSSDRVVHVGSRANGFDVREFEVRKDGETRVVHFWYRTQHESGFTSTPALRLRQFWRRLTTNRGDGALVRLSTPVDGDDLMSARIRLFGLDAAVEAALDRVWPGELREEPGRVDQRG